ncbi:sensor histidine kinase [Mangrovicoccus algicola]|uniref:histidine kinase n=1 Tax=Mangrovicoccus algicola TaxID=2771008 RepID=A0A8J6ZFI1_9RHOB|nr:sensor histidine kinase [Mangrovicoccus algicola]MBE3640400.1 sensor histidine kinase [Mangrovicoccus algicola]
MAEPQSLQGRVTGAVLSLMAVGGILLALVSWANGRAAAREAYDRLLLGAASDIAETVTIQQGLPVAVLPVSAFELLGQAPQDRVAYAIRGPGRALLTGMAEVPHPRGRARGPGPVFFDDRMQGEPARYVEVTRRFAERDFSGAVTVTVGQTLRARNAMALELSRGALLASAAAGGMLLLIALVVIRRAMRPLAALAGDLAGRDPHDLTPVDPAGLPAEMAAVLTAMNRFMARLDRQLGAMRGLISDTAHQLRTPVAAIRVQAEMALEEPDPARARAAAERLLVRTRSLGGLLDQMLSRALVIHRGEAVTRERVDLRDVALDVIDARDHELLAPGAEVGLVIGDSPVWVMADAFSLQEAAKNLLANALRHGRAPVRIGADLAAGEARLWVEDAGGGPPEGLMERLGERFERAAASGGQSSGLGLSIVRAVAAAFGGRIATQTGGAGFRIALVLPAAPGPAPAEAAA